MPTEHKLIPDDKLHENKGVAGAADDSVATASSGATVWKKLDTTNLDQTKILGLNLVVLSFEFPDICEPGDVFFPIPFDGDIVQIYTALQGPITTTDTILEFRNQTNASMGTITIAYSGSAGGDVDSLAPAANNSFTAGERLRVNSDGATDAVGVGVKIVIVLDRSP
jgi:hypothetical protein